MPRLCMIATLLVVVIARPAHAAEPNQPVLTERQATTQHAITLDNKTIRYTATAGMLPLRPEQKPPQAFVFYTAYTQDDAAPNERPILFAFNGGPGSSSVWLHMGAWGPQRVALPPAPQMPRPPFKLEHNPGCLLDVTDLVFIDPVSTGYSRAVEGEDPSQFHGVTEDVEAVGEFIRLYLTRENRWSSPKLLGGESYGTTRAAALVGYLQDRHGMYFNGVVLVSSVLNFLTLDFSPGNDLAYPLFLPSLTATAWYHQQLDPELQQQPLADVIDQARVFALGDYASALMLGDDLPADRRTAIVQQLAQFTSLSPEAIMRTNLRISTDVFRQELLRHDDRHVGRFDSRYIGYLREYGGEWVEYDPSYAVIQGAYTAMINAYLRQTLNFETDLPYEVLVGKGRSWNWQYRAGSRRFVTVADTLRQAMTQNPHLRVLVASGYYDLATPFVATEYTFSHLDLPPELRAHATLTYYEAGHMMYIRDDAADKFKRDVAAFIREAATTEAE